MKEEIIKRLEDLVREGISEETFHKADEIKNEFMQACQQADHEHHSKILADNNLPPELKPAKDPLDGKFNELIHILNDRERKFKKVQKDEIVTRLAAKQDVLDTLQKLIDEETNIGKAFQEFKQLQHRWNEIGNIPSGKYKNMQAAYHRHVHNFYYNMKLSKDLRDLDFKRNLEFRQQLLGKIESLLTMESARGMERLLGLYRMEWSELGPTAAETIEELRTRYRELIASALQKIRDFHQDRMQLEQRNLEAKKILLDRIVKISEEKFDTPKQWQTMTETVNRIGDDWKKIGYAPKGDNENVWLEFKKALNTFYANRRSYFSELKKEHAAHKESKLQLIQTAEEMSAASHESWEDATHQIIGLQKKWKDAGHTDSWDENKLWKKFRAACDKFFSAKQEFYAERDKSLVENLLKKEELIKRLEAYSPVGNAEEDLKALKEFSNEWKSIPHVPFKDKQRIHDSYKKALDSKYEALHLDSSQMHLIKFKNNVELMAHSEGSSRMLSREKDFIRDKLRKLQAVISQYENNLGFFSNAKKAGPLLKEVEDNLSKARSEMDILKKKLQVFNEFKQ